MEKEYLKAAAWGDKQEDQKKKKTGHLVHVYIKLDEKAGCGENWAFEVLES